MSADRFTPLTCAFTERYGQAYNSMSAIQLLQLRRASTGERVKGDTSLIRVTWFQRFPTVELRKLINNDANRHSGAYYPMAASFPALPIIWYMAKNNMRISHLFPQNQRHVGERLSRSRVIKAQLLLPDEQRSLRQRHGLLVLALDRVEKGKAAKAMNTTSRKSQTAT